MVDIILFCIKNPLFYCVIENNVVLLHLYSSFAGEVSSVENADII